MGGEELNKLMPPLITVEVFWERALQRSEVLFFGRAI